LLIFRREVKRAGIWFSVLPRVDRAFMDLMIRVANMVKGVWLANSFLGMVRKLGALLESRCARPNRDLGFSLSSWLSLLSHYGSRAPRAWVSKCFARCFVIVRLNG
jgi:hypothetical protein